MDFDKYESEAGATAVYPDAGKGTTVSLSYAALGLNGEAGEVAEKVKKLIRDKGGVVDDEFRVAVAKELGDCCWYLAAMAKELGIPLSVIAQSNLDKLHSRKARGVLQGSGDDR